MTTLLRVRFILISGLLAFSCSDKGTTPGNIQQANQLYQIPGCQRGLIPKSSGGDSCFSYQFAADLLVDFCVAANCCPDSNRFSIAARIFGDTIKVAVHDTAAQECRCLCAYAIHSEFSDLPLDRYRFICLYGDSVKYAVEVLRQ
jgi:hypothetical protein